MSYTKLNGGYVSHLNARSFTAQIKTASIFKGQTVLKVISQDPIRVQFITLCAVMGNCTASPWGGGLWRGGRGFLQPNDGTSLSATE